MTETTDVPETTATSDVPRAPFLSADSVMAYKRADPIAETLPIPELGGSIRIEGVGLYAERNRVYEEIAALSEQAKAKRLRVTSPATGETFTPVKSDIVAACWAAASVTEPKLTSFQWLQFCASGDDILGRILDRVLVCSRLTPDKTAGVPDGEAAAEAELEENPT